MLGAGLGARHVQVAMAAELAAAAGAGPERNFHDVHCNSGGWVVGLSFFCLHRDTSANMSDHTSRYKLARLTCKQVSTGQQRALLERPCLWFSI
jgi:hypothetical protein